MTDSLYIGLSGLLAAQRGLATTGHNIANVNTEGFSRQRVTFETREPQYGGVGFFGKGVNVQSIQRLANDFLVEQLRLASANEAGATKLVELVDGLDRQLGTAVVGDRIASFFSALGDANNDPRMAATRQVLLENARSLLAGFAAQESWLNTESLSVNQQMQGTVQQVNALSAAIADVNIGIARSSGIATGEPPNDLFDKRDQLLVDLSKLVGVQVQHRADGMINVLIGDGQLVVTGGAAQALTTVPGALDGASMDIAFNQGGTISRVTGSMKGGALGALIEFRDDVLAHARNSIGRLAAGFAMTVNAQQRDGMTLNGALGNDLFVVPPPVVHAARSNAGTITVSFDATQVSALTTSDYELSYDGANFNLLRLSDGNAQVLAGAGPFNFDGLTVAIASAPAVNDRYLIQPTRYVPRALTLATDNPSNLALASPLRSARLTSNIGEATVSRAQVIDRADPALLTPVQLVFNDPPVTYQVNGVGALLPYTSGADIDLNGWRVQIEGTPVAGDSFRVSSNAGGSGDNSNGLLLSQLQFMPILAGGTASYQEAYGALIGEVGARAQQARISSAALSTLSSHAQEARDALSGVNLEEEASNLLRYQQAFQAAAKVISAAEAMFQALINAT